MRLIEFYIALVPLGCPRGVMVKAMNCGIVVLEFVLQSRYYVHFRANTLGKGMNPLILPPAMGKQQDGLGSSALVRQLVQEKENSEFKPVKLRLKIDLVSYPARAEGLVNSTLGKGMNPIILPCVISYPSGGVGKYGWMNLVMVTGKRLSIGIRMLNSLKSSSDFQWLQSLF